MRLIVVIVVAVKLLFSCIVNCVRFIALKLIDARLIALGLIAVK